jgi:hypothetical protein
VDDDLDLLIRQAEEEMGLDQLQPLVGEGRRVDRDLRPHAPGRMGQRIGPGHGGELLLRPAAKRAARGGEHE